VIIATAGHVDHGKTSLIRQLTGVETDRLAEEQRRGLSINLGYAYLPRPQGTPLGFIDVPGHQRFINTMISGISGIDIGMLVIAADDGPMPQTHEHMQVLQLLGVERLVVVVSKIDRVSSKRLEEVTQQAQALLATCPWSGAGIFPVSNTDGEGIEPLKSHLLMRAEEIATRRTTGYFRLSIDRAFTVRGAGLVVTGTASAGSISVGDSLILHPGNIELRIRGIRVHDEKAERAMAGQRCALNIAGRLEAAAINRGDWLLEPGAAPAARRLDVHFKLLESAPFAIKHLAPVKMYIGAKRVAGRLAMLDKDNQGKRLLPGAGCLAQLILDEDVTCFCGERFLVRDHAENVILGGGTILDPDGPRSGKSRPERITWLNALRANSPAVALAELIAKGQLINMDRYRQIWNLHADQSIDIPAADTRLFTAEGSNWAVSQSRWNMADELLLARLDKWHLDESQLPGIKATDLKSQLLQSCEAPLVMAVLSARLHSGTIMLSEGRIHRAGFLPEVSAEVVGHWEQLRQCLERSGNRIPLLADISAQTGIAAQQLEHIVKKAVKSGELHSLTGKRYALPGQLNKFACQILAFSESGEPMTVVALKSHLGTGRNLTIEILEYFDRIRFTRRQGDKRVILDPQLPQTRFSG
jgi:selenocysteine-specific elongation factor